MMLYMIGIRCARSNTVEYKGSKRFKFTLTWRLHTASCQNPTARICKVLVVHSGLQAPRMRTHLYLIMLCICLLIVKNTRISQ